MKTGGAKIRITKAPDLLFEGVLHNQGHAVIAGVDEVGRGCWAGPVVAAAVILPPECIIPGVRDSKQLSPAKRESLAPMIKQTALAIGIGWASPYEIDTHGLTQAIKLSAIRALDDLNLTYDMVLLDGSHNYLGDYCAVTTKVKADASSLSVAAASVVAKVARDRYMTLMHKLYPAYHFHLNKGYGTKAHQTALDGSISPIHRRSFTPCMTDIEPLSRKTNHAD